MPSQNTRDAALTINSIVTIPDLSCREPLSDSPCKNELRRNYTPEHYSQLLQERSSPVLLVVRLNGPSSMHK